MKVTEEGPTEIVSESGRCCALALMLFVCVMGAAYYAHISFMHEQHVMFSHLSMLEREMFFRTENGFYYSFYKQLLQQQQQGDKDGGGWSGTVQVLLQDRLTEFPDELCALRRFNLYPELVAALLYRLFVRLVFPVLGVTGNTCYLVNREEPMPSVTSCDGPADPAIFYVGLIHWLHAAAMICICLLASVLSRSLLPAALVAGLSIFYNHRECTRVQWSAPLRENFAFPFLILQQLLLLLLLRSRCRPPSMVLCGCFCMATLAALLSWQFAQFCLLTQALALFLAWLLCPPCSASSVRPAVIVAFISLLLADAANILLQLGGSTLLLAAPYRLACLLALVLVYLEPLSFRQACQRSICAPLRWVLLFFLLLLGTLLLKTRLVEPAIRLLFNETIASDTHMWQILRSKIDTHFSSFDSLMYTCAPEFDFYELSSVLAIFKTGLLPLAGIALLGVFATVLVDWLTLFRRDKQISSGQPAADNVSDQNKTSFCDIAVLYIFFQTIAYSIMSIFIMRLKLLGTPQLCISASLITHPQFLPSTIGRRLRLDRPLVRAAVFGLLLSACSVQGVENLWDEWSISGVYSNWEQEQLLLHISTQLEQNASFAGQMALMATVRLATGRPITMHPHYEDSAARARVKLAYAVYSRRPLQEVWRGLSQGLAARYLVFEPGYCGDRPDKPQCSYRAMWDLEEPHNTDRESVCRRFERALDSGGGSTSKLLPGFRLRFRTAGHRYAIFSVLPTFT